MKVNIKSYIKRVLPLFIVGAALTACEDFLDKQPPSYIVPEDYYRSEDQILASANKFYTDLLPSHGGNYGTFQSDVHTDNQAGRSGDSKYAIGQWKVGMDNGNWSWSAVRNINYQLGTILDRYGKGEISGADKNIRHYIGEHYFFRAFRYFAMLRMWGDLPIVKEVFPDDEAILVAACKRMPRNEVARFILEDLDMAIDYMSDNFESRHTRISKDVAILMKSRVALFEGSWLTNFKGTPFVPNGEGWPGKAKEYNAGYQYPTGSIENEAKFFFEEAAKAAEIIAEKYKGDLVQNTGEIPQSATDPVNPYFKLFGNIDMSGFKEVLLWREYSRALGIQNAVETAVNRGNYAVGVTRSMVEGFLMEDGKPIYAQHTGYEYSDETLSAVRTNRDPRLKIFLKEPGQINVFINMDDRIGDMFVEVEPKPDITNGADDCLYTTRIYVAAKVEHSIRLWPEITRDILPLLCSALLKHSSTISKHSICLPVASVRVKSSNIGNSFVKKLGLKVLLLIRKPLLPLLKFRKKNWTGGLIPRDSYFLMRCFIISAANAVVS